MKILIIFALCLFNISSFAGTCSNITYTSNAANSVLTSTKYNTDNSTVYNFVNAYDGGCVSNGTLESSSLDSSVATGFSVALNGIKQGCNVTRVDAANLLIGTCLVSVNGKWVQTSTATAVTWANIDTGAEATGTQYYVFVDSTSAGATLVPQISATGPISNGSGFNASNDRILASFTNDASGDIAYNVRQWTQDGYFDRDCYMQDLTVTGTNWTTGGARGAKGCAKENKDGSYTLSFIIYGTLSSPTSGTFIGTIAGVDAGSAVLQAISANLIEGGVVERDIQFQYFQSSSFYVAANGTAYDTISVSGTILLDSKPAWAN